ncbi:nucleotidyltransferase domain-containing protein [Geobacter grbiciae]|uniref:nucleotidyltransferase domain-containing protein n=1 Tax=Geobacter grbiciae TaxID=155042 RepID=UPI001C00F53D|nr:nucleotidyltransferase domain-containing protein [Geobacter grbiciae]MBT1074294.1 nucleotidyltransferase domain-containing protein [Geobacter grbiciae]
MAQAIDVREIVEHYLQNLAALGVPVQKAFIFGSQATGLANEYSDIDLAVISPYFERMGLWDKAKVLGRATRDIPCPMDVLGYAPSQLKKIRPGTLLDEIVKNGIEIC